MWVLDTSSLIDYEQGLPAAKSFLVDNADDTFAIPATVHTEYVLGEANGAPEPDLPAVRAEIEWPRFTT